MIPILYESNETKFKSNGLGKLSDALSCTVTEERNGVFELSMVYPVTGIHYSDITVNRIILAKPSWIQDPQPFDIKTITPSTDGMTAEIYAQHISYRLKEIPVKPFTTTGINLALEGLKNNAMISNDFELWTDLTNNTSKFSVKYPKSFRACLGGSDGSILDVFSGSSSIDFMFDFKKVMIYRKRGRDRGVTIRYGKNLVSLKQETSIEDTYTGVVAYWTESQTGECVYGNICYADNHKSYPREKIYIYDASSEYESADDTSQDIASTKPTSEQLTESAENYLKAHSFGVPKVNLEVSFVDLSQTEEYENVAPLERVNLCDTVTIYFPAFNVNAKAEVIKTEWDVLKDRYNSLQLGDAKSQFSETIQQEAHDAVDPAIKQLPTKSFVEMAIDAAADLIKGGTSGHMVIGTNANGEANELYFMDTTDKATAKNVLRMNMNGIAFSQTGINGKYTTSWTIDGNFVADFITAGVLRAGLIKAGILSDEKGLSWWNMETGEMHLDSSATIGDKDSTDTIASRSYIDVKNNKIRTTVSEFQNSVNQKFEDTENTNDQKYVNHNDYTDKMNDISSDMNDIRGSVTTVDQKADRIEQSVKTYTDDQVKQATQWLDNSGLHVDTGETTQSNVDGNGMSVTDKASGDIIAKFVKGESQIQNVRITGMIKIGAHRMYEFDGTEYDGSSVAGTGFMWSGGE